MTRKSKRREGLYERIGKAGVALLLAGLLLLAGALGASAESIFESAAVTTAYSNRASERAAVTAVYLDGEEMKTAVSAYLKVLFDQNPAAVGGNLPTDEFYYGA